MTIKNDNRIAGIIRTVGICVGIAAFLFGALEAYISNKYETKENYVIATTATQEIGSLRKDLNAKLDDIEKSLHELDVEVRILQERVKVLPS